MSYTIQSAFYPNDIGQLATYYLVWIVIYLTINTVWDIKSSHTPTFHISHLHRKVQTLYNAATFCSSLLLLIALFNVELRKLIGDALVPLVLAGFSGILIGLSGICPYEPPPANPPAGGFGEHAASRETAGSSEAAAQARQEETEA